MKARKILLSILAIIVIAVVLIFIYGSTQPKVVEMERSIVINHDPATVYNYVSNFHNWKEWSAWNLRDTTMEVTYSGSGSGTGAVMSWTSEDSGDGTQTITEATPYSSIKTSLDFGNMGTAFSDWTFDETDEGTEVTWGFKTETGGPFMRGIMGLLFDMEEAVGKDYDEGLKNLKAKVESLPKVAISEEEVAGFQYIGVMNTVESLDMEIVTQAYTQSYESIGKYMEQAKLAPQGAPLCVVYEFSENRMVFEPAMMVDKAPANLKKPLQAGEVKACKAVKGIHKGDYAEMEPTYEAIVKYINDKGYTISGNSWEVYVTGPDMETDPEKWETYIYFPVSM